MNTRCITKLWVVITSLIILGVAVSACGPAAQPAPASAPTQAAASAPTEAPATEATSAPAEAPTTEAASAPTEAPTAEAEAAAEHCVPTSRQAISTWCYDSANEPLDITIILGTSQHSFYVSLREGALAAAEDFEVNVDVQGAAEFSPVAQTPIINAVMEAKPDALILVPTDPNALQERIKAVAEREIVVFTADNDTTDHTLRVSNVESNHLQGGMAAAHTLAKAIGEQGKVVVLSTDPTNLVPEIRKDGFMQGIAEYPEIEVLETQYCGFDITECANATNALLSSNPDLAGIFATGEPVGKGAGNAVRNAGLGENVKVGSFDASPAQQRDLAEGINDFLIVQKPQQIGYEVVRVVTEYLRGAETSESPLLPSGTKLSELPDIIHTGSLIAVNDASICPEIEEVPCGTADDPDIQPWLYQTIE